VAQSPADREQVARQLIVTIQALEDELVRGQNNLQMIELQSQRLAETSAAVLELKNHEPGDEVMIDIGSGVHLRVKLTDTSKVVTVIGAGFAAEKTLDEALKGFEEQQKMLTDLAKRQQDQLQATQKQIEDSRNQLSVLMQPPQGSQQ
jgi:prefoldin alpha subunit